MKKFFSPSFIASVLKSMHSRERTIFYVALGLLVISGIALFAQIYNTNTRTVPVVGGAYIEGMVGQPVNINPVLNHSNDVDRNITELVFSGLLQENGRGSYRLDLAKKIEKADDGTTWTIYLRDDVLWHDGEPFDADDVIFTVETVQDPDTNSPFFNSWQGVVAERVSALQVKFVLRNSYAAFEENLKELKIIPEHIFRDVPPSNLHLADYRLEPIGTGPFQFSGIEKKKEGLITSYTLSRNKNYRRLKIFLETVRFRFYKDESGLIQAFNNREIDGFGDATAQKLSQLNIPHSVTTFKLPRYFAIFLNQSLSTALTDESVRTALNIGTDKHSILKFVFDGYGTVLNAPIVSGMLGFEEELNEFTYDPEASREILEEAGWTLSTETSTTRTKDEESLDFKMIVPESDPLIKTADLIKKNWEDIGIGLEIQEVPLSDVTQNYMRNRSYQMLLFGNIVNFNTDLFAFWHSSQRLYPGLNLALYNNDTVDALIEKSRQSLEEKERVSNIKKAVQAIQSDTPAIFLYSPDYLYVTNNTLQGVDSALLLDPTKRFSQINKWYIKKARVFE